MRASEQVVSKSLSYSFTGERRIGRWSPRFAISTSHPMWAFQPFLHQNTTKHNNTHNNNQSNGLACSRCRTQVLALSHSSGARLIFTCVFSVSQRSASMASTVLQAAVPSTALCARAARPLLGPFRPRTGGASSAMPQREAVRQPRRRARLACGAAGFSGSNTSKDAELPKSREEAVSCQAMGVCGTAEGGAARW